jgi:xylulokinase
VAVEERRVSYVIGIDTSTTATKALVMDAAGTVVAVGRSEYGFETPRPLWSEQSPTLWWTATAEAIVAGLHEAGITGDQVAAVGLTGQMHGLVLLDAAGEVLRPAILWNDQRTQAECDLIRERIGRSRLIATTGNDALTGFTAPKLLWVHHHEPDLVDRIAHVLLPKDYVRWCLTGAYAMDKADGSGTLWFDLAARDWSPEVLAALEVDPAWLPPTYEGPEVTGAVTAAAAAATGLREGTPVVAGGGDQAANGVGVGAVAAGVVAISLGTSGVVFAAADQPVVEPDGRLHGFCHAVPGTWHAMGVMLSAAGSLRWFRDTLAADRSYPELDALAGAAPAGSAGLVFLPYLTGERTPHPDPTARGAFVGLTVRHGPGHLTRAVMEGVAFGLRDSVELLRGLLDLGEVRVAGGGAQSALWVQLLADVLDRPVRVVGTVEAAAHGAAMLAATSQGWFASVEEACTAIVEVGPAVEPTAAAAAYEEPYAIYRSLYPGLRTTFERLSRVDV